MNTYRAVSPVGVARFGPEPFDADFTVTEEADWIVNGILQLVARPYRVLTDSYTIDGNPVPGGVGAVVTAAFPIETEAALISGGHLERVTPPATRKKGKE